MPQKVISMQDKLLAVFTADLRFVPVARVCAELGISRQSFYKYRRRFALEGPAGLIERSRRPQRSPQLMPAELEDEIVRLRKTLAVDHGARAIGYHLRRQGRWDPVPSDSAIHRALRRRGLVVDEPKKRPKSATRRFEWPRPNDAWQIDATRWVLSSGREIWIMDVLDDHSRVLVAARVCDGPTTEAAWATFCDGVAEWGLPARVMSDNGACFTGRLLSGGEVLFEQRLRGLGIEHLCSTPGHPQTCGKLERSHQTTKRWLALRCARTPRALQTRLDEWRAHYNHHRPHSAANGATPAERWAATPPAAPGEPIAEPIRAGHYRVATNGVIAWHGHRLGIGTRYAGQPALVTGTTNQAVIITTDSTIRRVTLDPDRRYQRVPDPQ